MNSPLNHDPRGNSYPFDPAALPGDPRLDALLDEALSPDAVPGGLPAGLAERIVAATAPQLAGRAARRTFVIGAISATRLRWAAAAIAAAVAIVTGMLLTNLPDKPGATGGATPPTDIAKAADQLDRDLQLAASETGRLTEPVTPAVAGARQDIAQIKDRLDGELAAAVESWSDVASELEADLAEIERGSKG